MADSVTKTATVYTRVEEDVLDALNKLASRNERTASAEVRLAIRAHLAAAEANGDRAATA